MVVWVIFCLVMWAWAITGPLAVVMVTIALTLEPEWLGSVGETPREKMLNFSEFCKDGMMNPFLRRTKGLAGSWLG